MAWYPSVSSRPAARFLAAVLILSVVSTAIAQQTPPPSKQAVAMKQKIESLPPDAEITVLVYGQKEYGTLVSHDEQGFTLNDIDRRTNIALKYSDIKAIKDGYSGRNSFGTQHPQLKKGIIVAVVVLGVMTLVAVLAALDLRKS